MSDQQAQELTPAERQAYERACIEASERFSLYDDCTLHVFLAGLAARPPVQAERPDEPRFTLTIHGCPARNEPMAERIAAVLEADGYDCTVAAARLPERPDEGPEPRSRLRMMAHTRGFCPICSQAVPSRPADEGITEAMVDAAARVIADADGWDWHADDYRSPDPKWQPTDKADYRNTARDALRAALAARSTPSATGRAPTV